MSCKNFYTFILFISFIFLSGCSPKKEIIKDSKISSTLKIISVNLNNKLNSKTEVRKFVAKIKFLEPEILLVQQISRPGFGTAFDAVKELSKQLEMRQHFTVARDDLGYDLGNAILSIYPIMQTSNLKLTNSKKRIQHSASFGVIDVGVRSLGVISTELINSIDESKNIQLRELDNFILKNNAYPIFISGDFHDKENKIIERNLLKNISLNNIGNEINSTNCNFITPNGVEVLSIKEVFNGCNLITIKVIQQ
ncbi:MAG: hypothetical protein O3A55_00200 [Bacteroidetes bacterium]|nr:hypothetical protein [Bacteroidota bacterium]